MIVALVVGRRSTPGAVVSGTGLACAIRGPRRPCRIKRLVEGAVAGHVVGLACRPTTGCGVPFASLSFSVGLSVETAKVTIGQVRSAPLVEGASVSPLVSSSLSKTTARRPLSANATRPYASPLRPSTF